MKRREFIGSLVRIPVVGFLFSPWLAGCGSTAGTSGSSVATGTCAATAISSNHGHSLSFARTDLASASSKNYSIAGTAGHDHTLTVTAGDFSSLSSGGSVTILSGASSDGDGHTHNVTIGCASS